MDKIKKALRKLSDTEQKSVKEALLSLQAGHDSKLDLKKLKGRDDIYRVRKGAIRIIFRKDWTGKIFVLAVERRSDTTYNF